MPLILALMGVSLSLILWDINDRLKKIGSTLDRLAATQEERLILEQKKDQA